jgi:hypothetical protein
MLSRLLGPALLADTPDHACTGLSTVPVQTAWAAARASDTSHPPADCTVCLSPLVRRHGMLNGAGKPVTGL